MSKLSRDFPQHLTAAAVPAAYVGIKPSTLNRIIGSPKAKGLPGKQKAAWDAFDNIGEIHFFADGIVGASIETLAWYGATDDTATEYNYAPNLKDSGYSVNDVAAVDALIAGFKPAWGAQEDIMRALSINMQVPGECFLYTKQTNDLLVYQHQIVPKEDITTLHAEKKRNQEPKKIYEAFNDPVLGQVVEVTRGSTLDRLYRPHPGRPADPDSPLFAILDLIDELDWIQKVINNIFRQRLLLGGGILGVSNSMLGPDVNPSIATAIAGENNAVERALLEQLYANVKSAEDAPAMPPVLFTPRGEKEAIFYTEIKNELPENITREREAVILRIANSLSIPKEFVTGLGETSHWSAYLIRDLLWSQHIRPLATLLANQITATFLRPALWRLKKAGKFDGDPNKVKLWYQTPTLQQHPDAFEFLMQAYDIGAIGRGPIRRALGIPEEHAITDEEWDLWLDLKLSESGFGGVDEGEVGPDGTRKPPAPSRQRSNRVTSRTRPANQKRTGEDGPSQR